MRPPLPVAGAALGTATVVALLLAAPALSLLGPHEGPGAASDLPTFRLADSTVGGSELNLGVQPDGDIVVGGWDALAISRNDGATWQKVTIPLAPRVGPVTPPSASFAADRVLIVDKDTGRIFEDDTTLGCTILSWSDDDGATWTRNPLACGGGVTDHQKIAVGKRTAFPDPTGLLYPNVIYACANGLSHTNCGVSIDGGLTFLPGAPHGTLCAFQGAPVADRAGTLYEPTSTCGGMVRSTSDNGLSWSEFKVTGASPSSDTPDLATTDDGTIYYFHTTKAWKPALSRSRDGGATWEGPFAVPVAGLTSSVFPVIVGGAPGRVALAFYGTTHVNSTWDGNPGKAPDTAHWHGYVAVLTDADAAAPTIRPVQVTPPGDPLQIGCLSKLGGGCLGNIADYMDIDVGPDGRAYAIFVDGCLPGCTTKAQSNADNGIVAIQQGGPVLYPEGAPWAKPGPARGAAAVRAPPLAVGAGDVVLGLPLLR